MLRQGAAGIVFAEPRYIGLVESAVRDLDTQPDVVGLPAYEDLVSASAPGDVALLGEPGGQERTAVTLFTSGTTSAPKPVTITSGDVGTYVTTFADPPDLARPRGVSLVSAPLYH